MATTTNYGWTTPDDTSLVKDGASAIRTLGSAIDTSLNTALGTKKAGLVLLNTTSFSAVSSVSLAASTFTSTYTNYRILYYGSSSTTGQMTARLRAAGSDNSTSNYAFQNYAATSASVSAGRATGQTSWEVIYQQSSDSLFTMDLLSPQATVKTLAFVTNMKDSYNTNAAMSIGNVGCSFNATTSFDSLSLIPSAGTITGTLYVYGYNN